jgi:ribose 5-phosphate isomerase B
MFRNFYTMKIFIASDHAGFVLKESLKEHITSLGHDVTDCGAHVFDEADDYPDFVLPCAKSVANTPGSFGIILGASGQGEALAVNRIKGVRAVVYYGEASGVQKDVEGKELGLIESTRMHNDANVLSLGARFLTEEDAKGAVTRFLETPFSGSERHVRRIQELDT